MSKSTIFPLQIEQLKQIGQSLFFFTLGTNGLKTWKARLQLESISHYDSPERLDMLVLNAIFQGKVQWNICLANIYYEDILLHSMLAVHGSI